LNKKDPQEPFEVMGRNQHPTFIEAAKVSGVTFGTQGGLDPSEQGKVNVVGSTRGLNGGRVFARASDHT